MPKPTVSKLVMIRKTDEFSSVFSFRKRFTSEYLVIHYKPNQMRTLRVGFVVAKKITKLAVQRNYMRRVLRELCRQEQLELDNVDIVIQVKKPFYNAQFSELKQELVHVFGKIQHRLSRMYSE
ncbi:MAG TPA: ribonuclease P protein component [Methylophilaceae bacterium]|nr:ribonuclease P protein component [Methylophilaceae bacterium]